MDWNLIFVSAWPAVAPLAIAWATYHLITKKHEKYKKDLEKSSLRYQKIYEKQADIIERIYHEMVELQTLASALDGPNVAFSKKNGGIMGSHEVAKPEIIKKYNQLSEYASKNAIYFDDDKLKENISKFASANLYKLTRSDFRGTDVEKEYKGIIKGIKEIPAIKLLIEKKFQKILGVGK